MRARAYSRFLFDLDTAASARENVCLRILSNLSSTSDERARTTDAIAFKKWRFLFFKQKNILVVAHNVARSFRKRATRDETRRNETIDDLNRSLVMPIKRFAPFVHTPPMLALEAAVFSDPIAAICCVARANGVSTGARARKFAYALMAPSAGDGARRRRKKARAASATIVLLRMATAK